MDFLQQPNMSSKDSPKLHRQQKLIQINDVLNEWFERCRSLETQNRQLRSLVSVLVNYKHIFNWMKQQLAHEIESELSKRNFANDLIAISIFAKTCTINCLAMEMK